MSVKDVTYIWKKARKVESIISKEYIATRNEIIIQIEQLYRHRNYLADMSNTELRRFRHLLEDASVIASSIKDTAFKTRVSNLLRRKSVNYKTRMDISVEYYISLLTNEIIDEIDDLLNTSAEDGYVAGLKMLGKEPRQMSYTAKRDILSAIPFGARYSEFLLQRKDKFKHDIVTDAIRTRNMRKSAKDVVKRAEGLTKKQQNYTNLLIRQNTSAILNSSILQSMEDEKHEKFIIRSVIDQRTTDICLYMNNKVFLVSEGAIGLNMPPFSPPPHPCRTMIEPYFGD